MNVGKIAVIVIGAAVAIGLAVLAVRILSGFFALLGGALQLILGLAVLLALAAIVIWMFRYAAKNGKK